MAMNDGADGEEDKAGDKRQHSSNVSTMSEDSTATANSFGTKGTSKASTFTSKASSRASLISRASISASALLRKSLKVVGKTEEAPPELGVGDHCEAVTSVTMRDAESLESDVVTVLPAGTAMRVAEVGPHRRIKVEARVPPHGLVEGWVSTKTKMSEPLVIRCTSEMPLAWADFEAGGTHEVKSVVTVRLGESLDSEVVAELSPGAVVQICEVGSTNRRRVRVSTADRVEGWISTVTRQGAPLLGKIQSAPATNRDRQSRASVRTSLSTGAKSQHEAIFDAVKSGDLRQVRKVTERRASVFMKLAPGMRGGADVNACDVRGKTALIHAAAGGHKDIVEYLLLQGADVTAVDDTEKTALHHAARRPRGDSDHQQREVTRAKSSPSSSSSCSPATTWFPPTMADAHAEIVQILLHSGARVDARDHNGCTALMFAAANGRTGVARELLHTQADVNVRDKEGHRALDYASHFGHSDVVALLRRVGAEAGGWRVSEAADKKAAEQQEEQGSEEPSNMQEEVAARKPLSGEEATQAELQQLLELPPDGPQAPSETSDGMPEPDTPKQPPEEEEELEPEPSEERSEEREPSASEGSEVPETALPQLPPTPVAASKKPGLSLPPPPGQQGKATPHSLRASTAVSFPAPKPSAEGRLASTSDTAGDGLRASSVSTSASGGVKKKPSSKPAVAMPKRRPNPRLARSIPTMEAVREANEDDACPNARRSETRETRSTSASTTPTSRDPPSSPDHHFRLKLRDGGDLELRIATRGKSEHLEGYVRDSMSMTSSLSSSPSPRRSAYAAVAASFQSLREDTLPEPPTSTGGNHPAPFLPISPCGTAGSHASGTARGRALSAAAATGSKASMRPVSSPKAGGGGLSLRKSSTRSNSTQPPQQPSLRPPNRRLGTKEMLSTAPEGEPQDEQQRRRWKKQADRLQGTPSASPSPSEAADPKDWQADLIEVAI